MQRANNLSDGCISLARDAEVAQRISHERVDAETDNNKIWLVLCNARHGALQRRGVRVVVAACGQRHVEREANARALACLCSAAAEVGVRAVGVAVEGEEEDVRAGVEDVLGAVAVVVVDVDDGDALAVAGEKLGGDGRVVDEAVPALKNGIGYAQSSARRGAAREGVRAARGGGRRSERRRRRGAARVTIMSWWQWWPGGRQSANAADKALCC